MPPARALPFLLLACAACSSLPDTGRDTQSSRPVPPLLPLDALLDAPPPEANPELAEALTARGEALRQEAAAIE